jgi:hypothetical protein
MPVVLLGLAGSPALAGGFELKDPKGDDKGPGN